MQAWRLGVQKELEGDTTGTGDQLTKEIFHTTGHHAQFIKLGGEEGNEQGDALSENLCCHKSPLLHVMELCSA